MYRRHHFGASGKTRRAMLNNEHQNILMTGATVIYDGAGAQPRTDAIVTGHGHSGFAKATPDKKLPCLPLYGHPRCSRFVLIGVITQRDRLRGRPKVPQMLRRVASRGTSELPKPCSFRAATLFASPAGMPSLQTV